MSKITETKEITITAAIKCDRCENTYDDIMEMQEFLSWKDQCGYGNKTFGDGTHISIDLCQYCLREVLGEWITTY